MIEETATVVEVQPDLVCVEVQRRSSCDSCQVKSGCGTSVIQKVVGQKRTRFNIKGAHKFQIGDTVVLGLEEQALVKGSMAVYFLPLVLLISFAMLGVLVAKQLALSDTDLVSIIFALLGFGLGMTWLKLFSHRIANDKRYQPSILRRLL